jgi:hypothetical protein
MSSKWQYLIEAEAKSYVGPTFYIDHCERRERWRASSGSYGGATNYCHLGLGAPYLISAGFDEISRVRRHSRSLIAS